MEQIEHKYLNNDQVEREEWELISVQVRFNKGTFESGYIHSVFAYKEEVDDSFILRNGKYVFYKHYPLFVQRQLITYIKEQLPTTKKKAITRIPREKQKPITITKSITIKRKSDG